MTLVIPEQLKKNDFRFIRIAMEGDPKTDKKRPLDLNWINERNFSYDDKKLLNWINFGYNYGIACGYGNLAVIDADEDKISLFQSMRLPPTFTVKTGSGGMHYYYIIPDFESKIILFDSEGKHYGEIQWKGQQVIGPGSLHPSGNRYMIINNLPIEQITNNKIQEIFANFIPKQEPPRQYSNEESYCHVDLSKIINLRNFKQKGNEYTGSHPIHGSTTGGNFSINPSEELWHCFRCNTGGGPISFIAMLEGLIKCHECKPGIISNAIYQKVLEIAKNKYGVEIHE